MKKEINKNLHQSKSTVLFTILNIEVQRMDIFRKVVSNMKRLQLRHFFEDIKHPHPKLLKTWSGRASIRNRVRVRVS